MSFEEEVKKIGDRVLQYEEDQSLKTEEATKMALISPFIAHVLGFDISNPSEVVPEANADLSGKSGEKVDYSIIIDGKPLILIEAKHIENTLTARAADQLARYFHTTDSHIGVLTNGRLWKFYTDIDKQNVMDPSPFLVVDISDPTAIQMKLLRLLSKGSLNIEGLIGYAKAERHTTKAVRAITEEFKNPSEEFVRLIYKRTFPEDTSRLTAARIEGFKPLITETLGKILEDENRLSHLDKIGQLAVLEKLSKTEEVSAPSVRRGRRKSAEVQDMSGRVLYQNKNLNATVTGWFQKLAEHPVWGVKLKALADKKGTRFLTTDPERASEVHPSSGKSPWVEVTTGFWVNIVRSGEACVREFEVVNESLGTNVQFVVVGHGDEDEEEITQEDVAF